MVLDKLQESFFGTDLRPSKAHPEHRAHRKKLERESPAFSMQEFGIKTGMMALLALVACFPWEKELEEHERRKTEEEERVNGDGGRERGRDEDERRERRGEDERRERRRREGRRDTQRRIEAERREQGRRKDGVRVYH
jgi:hypothetical protein